MYTAEISVATAIIGILVVAFNARTKNRSWFNQLVLRTTTLVCFVSVLIVPAWRFLPQSPRMELGDVIIPLLVGLTAGAFALRTHHKITISRK